MISLSFFFFFFFFNDTATTEIYTLSLHDALPICEEGPDRQANGSRTAKEWCQAPTYNRDRKSTRLNSSHGYISYAVFCLKKKKNYTKIILETSSTTPESKRHYVARTMTRTSIVSI